MHGLADMLPHHPLPTGGAGIGGNRGSGVKHDTAHCYVHKRRIRDAYKNRSACELVIFLVNELICDLFKKAEVCLHLIYVRSRTIQ